MTKKSSFIKSDVQRVQAHLKALEAAEAIRVDALPTAPTLRTPHIERQFVDIAAHYSMDPYEIRAILQMAPIQGNAMVQEAFRKFVMLAKLSMDSTELGMDTVNAEIHHYKKQYEEGMARYESKLAERNAVERQRIRSIKECTRKIHEGWYAMLDGFARTVTQHKGMLVQMPVWYRMLAQVLGRYNGGEYLRITKNRVLWGETTLGRLKDIKDAKLIGTAMRDVLAHHQQWINDQASMSLDFSRLPSNAMAVLEHLSELQEQGYDDHDHMYRHLQDQFGWFVNEQRNQSKEFLRAQLAAGVDGFTELDPGELTPSDYYEMDPVEADIILSGASRGAYMQRHKRKSVKARMK